MCTCAPGAMSSVAKPMIWPNLRIGWPLAIGSTAILWPRMMRAAAVTPCTVTPGSTRVDGDDHVVAALSRSVRGAFFSGLSCMAPPCLEVLLPDDA